MSDTFDHDDDAAVLRRESAPEHGPGFWTNLENSMRGDVGHTAPLPRVGRTPDAEPTIDRSPRRWPLAAAAALLALVGIGALALRAGDGPNATTEVVAGPTTNAVAVPLDGPDDQDTPNDPAASADDSSTGAQEGDSRPAATADVGGVPAQTPVPAATGVPAATPPAIPVPTFEAAAGATGSTIYVPLDGGLPDDARFLATWEQRGVSWFAVTDPALSCDDLRYAEIRYSNASRITQNVRDPQLHFSGELSHFTIRHEQNLAAWLSACGSQLELYVATLDPTGQVVEVDLVWFGEGSASAALVQWVQDEVSLNSIDLDGQPFAVDYNIETALLSRNGGPSRIMLEAGAPARRSLTPLAATADAGYSYWAGAAPTGEAGACGGPLSEGVGDTLWLRQGEGRWLPAVADGTLVGEVTAMALEPEFSQVAFADHCPGEPGRVIIGTQRADGLISNLRIIDLTPYVPGFAAELFWDGDGNLRIETDNSEYGFGTIRYEYRFDDGRDRGIIVRLD